MVYKHGQRSKKRLSDGAQLAIIWGLVLILAVAITIAFNIWTRPVAGQSKPYVTCPAGTYEIGEPGEGICKNEPTGCPYGDSIPMDMCSKFEPTPDEPVEIIQGK